MKNILNNFTIRSLKLNKKRTIVTTIGIILSTALICAVAGVFASFQQTLINYAITSDGNYHTTFFNVPKNEQKYILENRNVKSYFITQGIGYSKLENSTNDYKPYLYLMDFDKTALNNFGLKLIEGRMPENSNEIIISNHIYEYINTKYNIGDKITLDISKRMAEGEELNQNNPYFNPKDADEEGYMKEYLEKMFTKDFTVVGVIERPNREIEDYAAPGFTIITLLDSGNIQDNANISVKFNNIKDTYKLTKEMTKGKVFGSNINSELMRWSGVTRSEETLSVLYGLAGIVIAIIIVSSIFVIRNSFAISITEKMKQYGMLASIGATKKQIKKNVLFEGLILGVIGIPIGILSGILATFILINLTTLLIGKEIFASEVQFAFNVPIEAILLSILLGAITIYFSCIFSARKAAKISPIDAIRSNEDIKIKSKKIRSPKIIKKIFGIGGEIAYKNLKRNKKKYRTTVISLIVSITVFISLSAFLEYVFGMSNIYYSDQDFNVSLSVAYTADNPENAKNEYQFYKNLVEKKNIDKYTIIRVNTLDSDINNKLTEEYKQVNSRSPMVTLTSIGEKAYKEYIHQIGGKYEDYKDSIIYFDNSLYFEYNEEKKHSERIETIDLKEKDEINLIDEKTGEKTNLKIAKVTDKAPFGFDNIYNDIGTFIISDEMMDKAKNYNSSTLRFDAQDPNKLCGEIQEEYDNLENKEYKLYITNYQELLEQNEKIILLISIFLYGFITVITLIGVTNIFNTITTNMNLRSKEFSMLKSIGMTKKEFNKMINLESIFYGVKSLVIGCLLGTGMSYLIYRTGVGSEATSMIKYELPVKPIVISIIFIMIIVGIIMRYSLNKINKQNIIETIRNDNI